MDGSWWRVLTKHGPLFLPENPMNRMKRHKDMRTSQVVSVQYVTGEEWRNNSRKSEEMEPKQEQHPVVDVTGDGSKV